jgi:hypothetical protein
MLARQARVDPAGPSLTFGAGGEPPSPVLHRICPRCSAWHKRLYTKQTAAQMGRRRPIFFTGLSAVSAIWKFLSVFALIDIYFNFFVIDFHSIYNPIVPVRAKLHAHGRTNLNAGTNLIVCQRFATPRDISYLFAVTVADGTARFFDDESGAGRIFGDGACACGGSRGGGGSSFSLGEDH